jgi:hypothetical protein
MNDKKSLVDTPNKKILTIYELPQFLAETTTNAHKQPENDQ